MKAVKVERENLEVGMYAYIIPFDRYGRFQP
jgi:hypothetical protein